MSPSIAEISLALEGAIRLLRRDPSGMRCFDFSLSGFIRSFFAILLAAPAYLIFAIEQYYSEPEGTSLAAFATRETVSYLVSWMIFPLISVYLLRYLDLGQRYVPLIVAGNWCSVVQMMIYLAAFALTLVFTSTHAATFVFLAATAVVLVYRYFVIRTALETTPLTAMQVLVIDTLVSIIAVQGIAALFTQEAVG